MTTDPGNQNPNEQNPFDGNQPAQPTEPPAQPTEPPAYPQYPVGDQPPAGEVPPYGDPQYSQPQYEQPQYGQAQYSQPGYQQPGYPYGQPGPPVPTSRPGTVLAAAIVLIVFGGFLGLMSLISVFGASTFTVQGSDVSHGVTVVTGIIQLIICIFAVAVGVMLLQQRRKQAAILATVAAALLILTCIGIIATIAVPILLWAPESSKAWFTE